MSVAATISANGTRRLALGFVAALLGLLWIGFYDGTAAQESHDVRSSLAQVRTSYVDSDNSENVCGVFYATGFVVDSEKGLVLTSLHGTRPELPNDCQGDFKAKTDIKVGQFADASWLGADLFARSDANDAAIYRIGVLENPPPALSLCQIDEPSFLAKFQIFGFATFGYGETVFSPPTSRNFEFNSVQTLEDMKQDRVSLFWLGTGNGEQGMSGGPVIDSTNGRVVGIYAGAVDSGSDAPSDFRLVVPLGAIERDGLFSKNAVPLELCSGGDIAKERLDTKKCDDTWLEASDVNQCFNFMLQSGMYVESISHRTFGREVQSKYLWKRARPDQNICFISCIHMPKDTYVYFDGSLQSQGFSRTSRSTSVDPESGIESLSGVWITETATNCGSLVEQNLCP